jgi:glycosyltransferase involved in cell wall biosynthesis
MDALVSILIPAYNAEKWIAEAIQSGLAQTWPRKEIIVIDDGSSDHTYLVARRYESGSVKVIRQENGGASAARNRAFFLSQGDYIQWLDADDVLDPNKISFQFMRIAKESNEKVLASSSWGKFYVKTEKAKFVPNHLWQDMDPKEWLLTKFLENLWMANSAWLVSRRLTNEAGPWDDRLSLDDDGEYFCRVVSQCERIQFVPESRCYYRIGNIRSLCKSTSVQAKRSLFLAITLSIQHLLALENSERTRSASLNYLRRWLYHFFPEGPNAEKTENKLLQETIREMNDVASKLGGEVSLPSVSWKYNLARKMFGREAAMALRNMAGNFQLLAGSALERMLCTISSSGKRSG